MNFYIPTFAECLEICEANSCFHFKIEEINGHKVWVFNYRLASYNDFKMPISSKPWISAFELRGLTFVEENDGTKTRYLMLHKFFNTGETEDYSLESLTKHDIVRVQDKLDGSMIRFIKVEDQIIAKTKFGFNNEQCQMAIQIYNNDDFIRGLVEASFEERKAPIFELISPLNKIVVGYPRTELRFIQLRYEDSGLYVPYNVVIDENIQTYLDLAETETDFEGWVITFANGTMAKLKTAWYKQMHRLVTEDLSRIDWIIQSTLNETIDDAISCIDDTNSLKKAVEENVSKIRSWFNTECAKIIFELQQRQELLENDESDSRKIFAIDMKENKYFPVYMKLFSYKSLTRIFDEELIQKHFKEFVLKRISSLSDAREFAEKEIGINPLRIGVEE